MITIYPSHAVPEEEAGGTSFFSDCSALLGERIYPFSSARAATVFALRSLGFTRMDEVLIPPWMSDCVVSAISKTAFASMAPSSRTRAIYVFHQFGYPQRIDRIEEIAVENDWHIINCCVHAPFSKLSGGSLPAWGDFSVLSLPKLYPCHLGGGLITRNDTICRTLETEYDDLRRAHESFSDRAYTSLIRARENPLGAEERIEISSIYGYLPEVVAFPARAFPALPSDTDSIEMDISRRKQLSGMIHGRFPDLVPELNEQEVVPFAVPIRMQPDQARAIASAISESLRAEVPVMHFDFNSNMLEPDYRTALVIGCHRGWSEELVDTICDMIEEYVKDSGIRVTD